MSRRKINYIFAAIVIGLAAAGISFFTESGDPIIRDSAVNENSDGTLPVNHPPEEIAKRLTALIQMSAEDPQNADILSEIGNTYYDLGDYDKAIAQYRKSLEIQKRNPYVETDLATCLHYLNRNDEALSILDNVLKYQPNFPAALYNKGVVLIHGKNDPQRGITVWEELLKQDIDPTRRAEIEQSIREHQSSVR
ncbi:MAG: tetratricopeptide repeat protein [Acidobacteria bacterium]|nr:tetratricopeptide repeat protein [Acidobacteriota bacterium]